MTLCHALLSIPVALCIAADWAEKQAALNAAIYLPAS